MSIFMIWLLTAGITLAASILINITFNVRNTLKRVHNSFQFAVVCATISIALIDIRAGL